MMTAMMGRRLAAEFLGTFWFVFAGCGTAIFAKTFIVSDLVETTAFTIGVGILGVALAFGLGYASIAYAVGHVSGAHFNPAVTIGAAVARRFEWREVPGYLLAQVLGGMLAGASLLAIGAGKPAWTATGSMNANGYGLHSPGFYSLTAVLVAEIILTGFLVVVVLGVTDSRSPDGFEPLIIGLAIAVIYLVSIPLSNGAVNPARSTGVALFNGQDALVQLWLFWVAPLVGAAIAGATFHLITGIDRRDRDITGEVSAADALVAEGVDPDAPREAPES